MDHSNNIDEELYSRQLYVIGHDAMMKMMSMEVLIIGMDGLGQEIAKNICLAGLRSVSLYDKNPVTIHSLCSGFFFSKSDLGQPRDQASLTRLKALNKYVQVKVVDKIELEKYNAIVSINQTIEDNLRLNGICHSKNIKFVMANASGLFTQIFCDFQDHLCTDKNGGQSFIGSINDITTDGLVTFVNGVIHTLDEGDTVKIKDKQYKISVINRTQIKLLDYRAESLEMGGDVEEVKVPFTTHFKSLKESLETPEIMDFDMSEKHKAVHDLFTKGKTSEKFKELEEQFIATKGCLIAPICSVIGGLAAQEVIKACSSKFMPFYQFFYYEASEAYVGSNGEEKEFIDSRYFDMVKIFGGAGFEKIKNMKIFLVGSGAIGCENIKNFVMSGLCSNGRLTVTDMDSIEQSNLNRQFLFREEDVMKMKSDSAIKNATLLNEDFSSQQPSHHSSVNLKKGIENIQITGNLVSYTIAVNSETETTFSDTFLKEQDLVSNALDNVEARIYMDRRCVQMRKPLVDAGTLGTKGHVQVVVPFISETYSSSEDPQDKSIPLCTVKSFPYTIEHTIEWALGEFKTHFNEKVNNVKEYLTNKDSSLEEEFEETPRCIEGCLKVSLALFVNYFSTSITKLLESFAPDHVDQDGNLFWSPPKRIPSPVAFNINDKMHIGFLLSCANLHAECFGIRKITMDEVYAYLENVLSLKEPNPIDFGDEKIDFSVINPLEFDKDTWHVDFVYTAANLRARNYGIKEKSKHFVKGVAGRIIPAIATTTAVVSGISTLEILKYAVNRDARLNESSTAELCKLNCKNSYLDLAIPFLASTELIKPKSFYLNTKNKKIKFTTWSRMEFSDAPLSTIVENIQSKLGIEVSMVSVSSRVVFWNLSNKYEQNSSKTISELCDRKLGQQIAYIDVLPEEDTDMIDIAIVFDQ